MKSNTVYACTDTSQGGSTGCTTCTYSNNAVVCSAVSTGYFLKNDRSYSCSDATEGQAGCATCSYATSTLTCLTVNSGYYVKTDTAYSCSDAANGGLYACSTCTYANAVFACSATATTLDTTTAVGWYFTNDATNWNSNSLAGCRLQSSGTAAPTTATCTTLHAGWIDTDSDANTKTPGECTADALCLTCTPGALAASCLTYWGDGGNTVSDGTTRLAYRKAATSSGGAVYTFWQYDNLASGLTVTTPDTATATVTAVTCATGGVLVGADMCFECDDADVGVVGATTCTVQSYALTATACGDGYTLITGTCVPCPTGATQCSSATVATVCGEGYLLSGGTCAACPTGATQCSSASVATACEDGYSLIGGACVQCPTGATTCSSTTVATACRGGYFLSGGACTACATGAATCSSAAVALTCAEGHLLIGSTCTACADANAATCLRTTPTAGGFASTCKAGYFPHNGACTAHAGCATFHTFSGSGFQSTAACRTAADGYFVGEGSVATSCGANIEKCSLVRGRVWVEACATGFVRVKGSISSSGVVTYPECVVMSGSGSVMLAAVMSLAAFVVLVLLTLV